MQAARVADGRVDLEEERRTPARRSPSGASGLSSDQPQPRTDRLYLPRSSRSVRFANSSRWRLSSETVVIVGGPERGPLAGGIRYRLMRITFVSAHYPPNFVSGGTLQPQRLARGLRDRGHDVRVFAGCLDSTRTPAGDVGRGRRARPAGALARDDAVLIDWADERNYDNPRMAERFAAHLARAPRGRGAPAHAADPRRRPRGGGHDVGRGHGRDDARLLVGLRPPVPRRATTDPAASWSRPATARARTGDRTSMRRAERLREALRSRGPRAGARRDRRRTCSAPTAWTRPSSTSTRTGWICRRPGPTRPGARRRTRPIVVRYTGGSNPMKGADVLLEAAHQLGAEPRSADRRPRPRRRRGERRSIPGGHLPRGGTRLRARGARRPARRHRRAGAARR